MKTEKLKRVCVYPKDIQILTGKSNKSACRLLAEIKRHFNKKPHQYISIKEFSEYTGISVEDVDRIVG